MRWHLSLFAGGAKDAHPRGADLDRAALVSLLTEPEHCPDKSRRQAWSAARYPAGARRGYGQTLDVSCLVLDYDGTAAIEEGAAVWSRWAHIVHTSWSHGAPEATGDRYRVVLPLATPIPRDDYGRLWRWSDLESGHAIDRACKDPCRLWFLPSRRIMSWPYRAWVHEGRLLDWRNLELPQPAPKLAPQTFAPVALPPGEVQRERYRRVLEDPETRRRMADVLGATLYQREAGLTATRIQCPKCGDRTVWFFVDLAQLRRARCNHVNTCGWSGHLWELGA